MWPSPPEHAAQPVVEIISAPYQPDLPTIAEPDLPAVAKPDLPAVAEPDLPTVAKPDLPTHLGKEEPAPVKTNHTDANSLPPAREMQDKEDINMTIKPEPANLKILSAPYLPRLYGNASQKNKIMSID